MKTMMQTINDTTMAPALRHFERLLDQVAAHTGDDYCTLRVEVTRYRSGEFALQYRAYTNAGGLSHESTLSPEAAVDGLIGPAAAAVAARKLAELDAQAAVLRARLNTLRPEAA
jgi:hypothetical protein